MTPLDLDEIARRPTMLYRDEEAFVVLLPAERDALVAAARGPTPAMISVCNEITDIMKTYHEQEASGGIDTPGGLEHMGDVWRLLSDWEDALRLPAPPPARGPEMPADVAGTVRRLKSCTAQHARTTPRDVATLANNAATLIEALDRQRRSVLRDVLSAAYAEKHSAQRRLTAAESRLAALEAVVTAAQHLIECKTKGASWFIKEAGRTGRSPWAEFCDALARLDRKEG